MGICSCDNPTEYRATSESINGDCLYLRCAHCGGKAGQVAIDMKDFRNNVTSPDEIGDSVTIRFDPHDSTFTQNEPETKSMDRELVETYGKRELENQKYWVYVLDCRHRFLYDDYNELRRKAEKRLGEEPAWLRMAWESRSQKYIGQTENLFKRLGEHFRQRRRTNFTELFEASDIEYLRPAYSRSQAESMEESIGKSYYDDDDVFAYWR